MLFIGPLADTGDSGVIDLDFVMNLIGGGRRAGVDQQKCEASGKRGRNSRSFAGVARSHSHLPYRARRIESGCVIVAFWLVVVAKMEERHTLDTVKALLASLLRLKRRDPSHLPAGWLWLPQSS
jgi:hypothetical protein